MREVLLPAIAVAVVAVAIALLAVSHRVLARMALRNAFRRRSRILIVTFGLLVGTMIISSSLSVGDTLEYIFTGEVYRDFDAVDVTVSHEITGQLFDFPESYFSTLRSETLQRGIAFDGMAPALQKAMPVRNGLTGSQAINVMGLDDAYEAGFGDLVDGSGRSVPLATLPADGVVVNEGAARDLNASVGDALLLFWGNTVNEVKNVTVQAVVTGAGKGGWEGVSLVFAPLASAQAWFNATGKIDLIRVSAPGPAIGGERYSAQLAADLQRIASAHGWSVAAKDVKGDGLRQAQEIADQATQLFLVMGSFAIFAGLLLIVNVFVMLAEERKAEMGVSRAIGMRRRHLTIAFLLEGSLYVAMAAAAGALAGVGLGWLMILVFNWVFPPTANQGALVFHVEPGSVVIAFAAGVLLTTAAVGLTSAAISRLNVVRAIRKLPEPPARRLSLARRWLVLLTLVGGAVFALRGFSVLRLSSPPVDVLTLALVAAAVGLVAVIGYLAAGFVDGRGVRRALLVVLEGVAVLFVAALAYDGLTMALGPNESPGAYRIASLPLVTIGLATLAARWVPARLPFTASGLATLWWLIFAPVELVVESQDDIAVLFVETGVLLVLGAVLVAVLNTSPLLRAVLDRFGRKGRPVVRAAVAYPMGKKFRTGMTLAMFALTIFSITVIAMVQGLQAASLDKFIEDQSGGYQLAAYTQGYRPIPNFRAELVAHNISLDNFEGGASGVAEATVLPVAVNKSGDSEKRDYTLWGVDNFLIQENTYAFYSYLPGITFWNNTTARYEPFVLRSRGDVWRALQLNRSYAVLDRGAAGSDQFGSGFGALRLNLGDHIVATAPTGNATELAVLGILQQSLQFTRGVFVDRDTVLARYPLNITRTAYFFQLAPGVDATRLRPQLESAFFAYGLLTVDIRQEISQQFDAAQRVLLLMQAYLALGLLVGITGLGVITVRAVVERRQEIGAMRALGFTRRMVRRVFLLEIALIAAMGLAIGMALGIVLAFNVYQHYFADVAVFVVPYAHLAMIGAIAIACTFVATAGPALRASRLPPADTLRYIE